jgi:hypothetical protein
MLISIMIRQGKPDEACAIAQDVLSATSALGSFLVVQQLGELERLLEPHRRSPDVAALLERLRGELRERRWLTRSLLVTEPSRLGTAGT